MASAVLANQNEPHWKERKMYTRKYPNTITTTFPNNSISIVKTPPNPIPNSRVHPNLLSNLRSNDARPLALPGGLAFPNLTPIDSSDVKETLTGDHVTFNLGSYTRRELKDLKKRLVSELEQVRTLRNRIENIGFNIQPVRPSSHQRLPPPPPANVVHSSDPQKQHSNRAPRGRKKGSGSKRSNPFSKPGQNPNSKRAATNPYKNNVMTSMMRRCGQILTKLMKNKHGWVFNVPVDVVSLRLHDYNNIIKKPMDLGTVKSNLEKNLYRSPLDFASDVRLTFNNALSYNPRGHNVYFMAETLLAKFEEMFNPAFKKFQEMNQKLTSVVEETISEKPEMKPVEEMMKQSKATKVKEKREMSYEEKKMLGQSLMALPQEEMLEFLNILKKRGGDFLRDGDEIELDIETLDNQTLWELDRFVKNSKKAGSAQIEKCTEKRVVVEEEDVDIGDDIPVVNYPPVEIERDVNDSSSSSSSGSRSSSSDSSSSSGSDTGSSSGSESEDGSGQSPKDANAT